MLTALTRGVSPTLDQCELSYLTRQTIDIDKAREQHEAYKRRLSDLGVRVISLPAEPDLPDAVFVEDPAVVVDEFAVITTMGSDARRQEVKSLADHLSSFRELKYLKRPANLEGGDVMRVDHTLYIGISGRTNLEGLEQLTALLSSNGYQTQPVRVAGCLHLKTGCTYLGRNTLLVNPDWVDTAQFHGFKIIAVHPSEPWGANALTINGVTLLPSAFPKTAFLLEEAGFKVETLDISELLKAEAGLTCLSLIFNAADTLNIQ